MNGKRWSEKDDKTLRALAGKHPVAEIARRLDRSYGAVAHHAMRLGIDLSNGKVGAAPRAKTTRELTDNARLVALRKKNHALNQRITELQVNLGHEQEVSDRIVSAVETLPPLRAWRQRATKRRKAAVTAVAQLGDWHIGEVIVEEETVGYGVYDWAIAQRRIHQFCADFLEWIHTQRQGYKIDELVIPVVGDMVSGDIHAELSLTNEFPSPVAASLAGRLLAEVTRELAGAFRATRLVCVTPDNHGRFSRKPPFKRAAERNWNYIVYEIASAWLRDLDRLTIKRSKAIRFSEEIRDWTFLIEHGHTVRGWMGIPFYGIARQKGREAIKHMALRRHFDWQLIGHWHKPFELDGTICNGCLAGTTELDHGESRFAAPSQNGFLVGKHGPFGRVPFRLD